MSNYILNCLVSGEGPNNIFQIEIAGTKTIGALKELIKEKKQHAFRDVDADTLQLWKVPVDLPAMDPALKDKLNSLELGHEAPLLPVVEILEVFNNPPERMYVHIVVQRPPTASSGPPTTVNLNCVVLGDGPDHIFQIEITPTTSVSALKKLIKEEKKPEFDAVAADRLKLWQVKISSNDPHLLDTIGDKGGIKGGIQLNPTTRLSKVFTNGVEDEDIHIIVQHPAGARGGSMEDPTDALVREFQNALHFACPAPSTAAKSKEYRVVQAGPLKIYDGRYADNEPADTTAPPIQLFHPAFAYFTSKAFNDDYAVPDETLRDIQKVMTKFAAIHASEDDRKKNLTSLLEKVIGQPLIHAKSRHSKYSPDGIAVYSHNHIPIHLIVVEEKNELGDGNSDPSVQASFSFLHLTREPAASESRSRCNCPTFLIAHAGPWLAVLGAVFTDKYIVQRLTDYIWIPVRSALDDDQFLRVGRILYALRESVAQLQVWYDKVLESPYDMSGPVLYSRFYPTPDTYPRDGNAVRFTYQRPLERHPACVTYLAKTAEVNSINVVVKFVTRYGEDVHKAMAEKEFAPKLLYYGRIDISPDMPSYGSLRMVVMDYVDGQTAFSAPKLPPNFQQDITTAIEYCHKKGFVFGDLRKPNVMITKSNKVQLIDFDWAGREREVRYPVSISSSIDWPKGAQALELILKEHDRDMLLRYRN